jgi:hypothetical protein
MQIILKLAALSTRLLKVKYNGLTFIHWIEQRVRQLTLCAPKALHHR